jgi:hypothetical protein
MKKPTTISIIARTTLADGSTIEFKMVGAHDPRLAIYKEAIEQGLMAKLEIIKSVATHEVIAIVEAPKN